MSSTLAGVSEGSASSICATTPATYGAETDVPSTTAYASPSFGSTTQSSLPGAHPAASPSPGATTSGYVDGSPRRPLDENAETTASRSPEFPSEYDPTEMKPGVGFKAK